MNPISAIFLLIALAGAVGQILGLVIFMLVMAAALDILDAFFDELEDEDD